MGRPMKSGRKAVLIAAGAAAWLALKAVKAFGRRGAFGPGAGGPAAEGIISSEDAAAIREWATPRNILAAMVRDGVITREQADGITAWRRHLQPGQAGTCAPRPDEHDPAEHDPAGTGRTDASARRTAAVRSGQRERPCPRPVFGR